MLEETTRKPVIQGKSNPAITQELHRKKYEMREHTIQNEIMAFA
jgi:hypothetical protein